MKRILLVAVSAIALAYATGGVTAQEWAPLDERFSTDIVIAPTLFLAEPTSPAYMLGVGSIADDIDPITTGEVVNRDAEKAAEGLRAVEAAQPSPVDDPVSGADAEAVPAEGADRWATVRGPMPFDIIRTIQFLQDQVSRGNGRAIQVQAALLRRFGPVFVKADPSVWEDGRNRRAAVLFVLSGGPPAILRQLIANGVVGTTDEPLFQGALAYVESDLGKAETLLSTVDFAGMEPGLEAHVNLVLGQVKQLTKPEEARSHLDRARLLAPGGLIEEAALRMEMLIVDELGDHATADRLARQYFDRYAQSTYSANFEARFASVYATRGRSDPSAARDQMLDVTAGLAEPNRRTIFLAVGRRALVEGNLAFASLAAEAALATGDLPDPERQRAALYAVAARIGQIPGSEAGAALAAIDRAALHVEDVKLYDAAVSVLDGIAETATMADGVEASGADADEKYADTSPVFGRAEQLMGEIADDLEKAQP